MSDQTVKPGRGSGGVFGTPNAGTDRTLQGFAEAFRKAGLTTPMPRVQVTVPAGQLIAAQNTSLGDLTAVMRRTFGPGANRRGGHRLTGSQIDRTEAVIDGAIFCLEETRSS